MRNDPRIPKRPTRIALSDENRKGRIIAVCVLLALGLGALGYGIYSLLRTEPGWQTVDAACDGINVSQEFTLQYHFSGDVTQRRQLTTLYSRACEDAYWIFTRDQAPAAFANLHTLNHAPNRPHSIDPALYDALALLEQSGTRYHYLGPVYAEYNSMFLSQSDAQAAVYDPRQDPDQAAYFRSLLDLLRDPEAVRLELREDHQAILHASPEYLDFAREYEIEDLLDLGPLKNAFITDYIGEKLLEQGFTGGFVASFDGFTRNLDESGTGFSQNIFDFRQGTIYKAAVLDYRGPMSLVDLRSFPMSQQDRYRFYVPRQGAVVSSYIDPADGLSKAAVPSLLAYSPKLSCGQIALQILPLYTADALIPPTGLPDLHCIWTRDRTVYHTQKDAALRDLLNAEDIRYKAEMAP